MIFLKAFLGGIFGGAIGAQLAESIQPTFQSSVNWAVLLAGLLAGIGTRLACRADRSFMTGLTAAVATILAISGISFVTSRQATELAERSMANIPVRTNFEADVDDLPTSDPNNSPSEQPSEVDSSEPSTTPDLAVPTDPLPAPAGATVDPWKNADLVDNRDAATNSLPIQMLLFDLLAALLAFAIGTGSALVAKDE